MNTGRLEWRYKTYKLKKQLYACTHVCTCIHVITHVITTKYVETTFTDC